MIDASLLRDYEIKSTLGEGEYSKVYFAIHKPTETSVSIKIIRKTSIDTMKIEYFLNKEICIMKEAVHPFICRFYEAFESDLFIYIVMEYISGGTLLDEIYKSGKMNERDASIIFSELMLAISYLHKHCHAAHRDIKAENILLDENHNIRLIDFGFSNLFSKDNLMTTQCGSIYYAAPELIVGQEYTEKIDVWSAGILLYLLVTGSFPFSDFSVTNLAQKIVYDDIVYPSHLSLQVKDLISRMLIRNPKERITVDEILSHQWVRTMEADIASMIDGICIADNMISHEQQKYKCEDFVCKDLMKNIIVGAIFKTRIKSAFYMSQTKPNSSKSQPTLALEQKYRGIITPQARRREKRAKIMPPLIRGYRKSIN